MQREDVLRLALEEFQRRTGRSPSYIGHKIKYGGNLYKKLCTDGFAVSPGVFDRAMAALAEYGLSAKAVERRATHKNAEQKQGEGIPHG